MSTQELNVREVAAERFESFGMLSVKGELWDLSHLDSFAFRYDLECDLKVIVVVLFSCHCFTRGFERDPRPRAKIPRDEIYDDGREQRVFCPERYALSRRVLRELVLALSGRRIILADDQRGTFVTFETTNDRGTPSLYAVFFEVSKDKLRNGRRLILRVQSAYVLDHGLTRRQLLAKRVTLRSILLAALEGRTIRP